MPAARFHYTYIDIANRHGEDIENISDWRARCLRATKDFSLDYRVISVLTLLQQH